MNSTASLGRAVLLASYRRFDNRAKWKSLGGWAESNWYVLLLEQLVHAGYLDSAEVWGVCRDTSDFAIGRVQVRAFGDFRQMAHSERPVDLLWVRGDHRNYLPVLDRLHARLRVFYAASSSLVPSLWNHYDLLLVDDERHIQPARRITGTPHVDRVIKTADPEVFRPLPGVAKQFDLCMIASMHYAKKNHQALVDVLRSQPNLSAVCVGRSEPQVEQALRQTGAQIALIERCDRREMNEIMNRSRIGFVPSTRDAVPRVMLEFMAAGVPVLLNAAIPGGRDYLTPLNGRLVEQPDMPAAVEAMLGEERSFDARGQFERLHSPRASAQRLGTMLQQIAQQRHRHQAVPPPHRLVRILSRPRLVRRRMQKYLGYH